MAHLTGDAAGAASTNSSKGPVLLLAPLLGNVETWVNDVPMSGKAIPYRLFDEGFDVYLGDWRGIYSA